MDHWQGEQLNRAKEILAFELTKLVHSEAEAQKAQDAARALFADGGDKAHMPTTTLTAGAFTDGGIGALDLMVKCGLAASKGEARRLVQQGGLTVNGEKVSDPSAVFAVEQFSGDGLMLKKGKKVFHRAVAE